MSIKTMIRCVLRAAIQRTPYFRGKGRLAKYFQHLCSANEIEEIRDYDGNIAFRLRLDSAVQNSVYFFGYHERHILDALRDLLRSGDTLIDIGANIGYFTIPMAKHVGNDGRVLAFEPNPLVQSQLEENVALNALKNVILIPLAVGARSGTVRLYYPRHGSTRLYHDGIASVFRQELSDEFVDVGVVSLDSYLKDYPEITPKVIKIDVEGAEFDVLQGMAEAIRRHRPTILCEFNLMYRSHSRAEYDSLLNYLTKLGYVAYTPHRIDKWPIFCADAFPSPYMGWSLNNGQDYPEIEDFLLIHKHGPHSKVFENGVPMLLLHEKLHVAATK